MRWTKFIHLTDTHLVPPGQLLYGMDPLHRLRAAVHSIATDSKGNIYTTETYEGKRLQKFRYKGVGAVKRGNQGVVWPTGK